MKFGIPLGQLNPAFWAEVAQEADRLGFESVWLPEHLVLPLDMSSSPYPGQDHPPVPPTLPVYDAFAYLAYLAGLTGRIRLGTHVYNLGLRHPFVAARGAATVDIVSGGRFEFGIGASWLRQEWEAVGLDFSSRGRRVDESVAICKRLWTEPEVEHHGEFFSFAPVAFEPKPVQRPWPPLVVGGETPAALRRAATTSDGWIGMGHTPESVAEPVAQLARLREDAGRAGERFEVTVGGAVESRDDVKRWEEAGVHRLIVSPWPRSPQAVDTIRRFADSFFD